MCRTAVMLAEEMQLIRCRPFYLILTIIVLLYFMWCCSFFSVSAPSTKQLMIDKKNPSLSDVNHILKQQELIYNPKYPLSDVQISYSGERYTIAIIADLDEERSKVVDKQYTWRSFLKTGHFTKLKNGRFNVEWKKEITLTSNLNEKGRGLELSELCAFNGKLYTVDDRTGLVYEIINEKVIPWVILMDGDGSSKKGFKGEWMTVKNGVLYIGGLGKEWTTKSGTFINYHPLFVKSVDHFGAVMHHNWTNNYINVRAKIGIMFPGYMIHEAVMWSDVRKKWYFLPRRMSKQRYDDVADERRGTNVLISTTSDFKDFKVVYVGGLDPTRGFSSFKFLPGSKDGIAVALKTREVEGNISTYIMVFNVDTGRVLMSEQFVAYDKYEGLEFI